MIGWLLAFSMLSPSALAGGETVRVRIHKGLHQAQVRGVSLHMEANEFEWHTVGLSALDIKWSKGFWRMKQTDAPVTASFEGDVLLVKGAFLQLQGRRVTDELRFVRKDGGRIDVVAVIPIEEYLAGVIPSEMPVHWPKEALKAQAVAARSFALRMKQVRRHQPFDLDSTVFDQVHRFEEEMNLKPKVKRKLKRVIAETSGQILRDRTDRVLPAFYSADCGCVSEDPKYVWGEDENFESVQDPTCEKRRPRQWQLTIERGELRKRLMGALKVPDTAAIKALHVGQRSPSGRVSTVMASVKVDGRTESRVLSSQDFRRLIGFDRVRSTDFSLKWIGDLLHIAGQGIGHGVGLCQTGARALAQGGANYHEILKLYYPKAKISSL